MRLRLTHIILSWPLRACAEPQAGVSPTRRRSAHITIPLETYQVASKGFPNGYSKKRKSARLHSENSKPMMLISQTRPDEHTPTPPPCRWPALITLPTLANFQLVWHRLCDVVLFRSSCLFEHTLAAVCVLSEHRSSRKYKIFGQFVTI